MNAPNQGLHVSMHSNFLNLLLLICHEFSCVFSMFFRPDGWKSDRMDRQTLGRADGRADRRTDGRTVGRTDGRSDGRATRSVGPASWGV